METPEHSGLSRWMGEPTIAQSSSSERERSAKARTTIKSALSILVSPVSLTLEIADLIPLFQPLFPTVLFFR